MKTKIKSVVKGLLRSLMGIEIRRYSPVNYGWLNERNISAIIDIGANVGEFCQAIDTILPGVRIFAFEPIKTCYDELIKNCKKLNIVTYNLGLGEGNYEAVMNVSAHAPSSSLLEMADLHKKVYPFTDSHQTETIKVKRLDDIAAEMDLMGKNIFIKLDVQGFEDRVIAGGRNTFSAASVVQIEVSYQTLYKGQALFDEIYFILRDLGFRFAGNIGQVHDPRNGDILFSDSLFLRPVFVDS